MGQPCYTYDPTKIKAGGKDQMRFELGDTMVEGGADTCALCDEEYQAIIEGNRRWKVAKYECLKSILFRFMYEVDTDVGELSLALHQRRDAWKAMLDDLEKEVTAAAPIAHPQAIKGPHYFHVGMMENRRNGGTEGGPGRVPPPR